MLTSSLLFRIFFLKAFIVLPYLIYAYDLDVDGMPDDWELASLAENQNVTFCYSNIEFNPQDCVTDCDLSLEDSDKDGMPNVWEIANGLDECDPLDAFCDYDGDQVINLFEYQLDSDPNDLGSPRIINATPMTTQQELQSFVTDSESEPVVIRFSEGIYGDRLLDSNELEDVLNLKFMVQGGWSSDFSDHDPFKYPTIIRDDFRLPFFFYKRSTSEKNDTYIFEGLELINAYFWILGSSEPQSNISVPTYFSVYNCSFSFGDSNSYNKSIWLAGEQNKFSTRIINSTFTKSRNAIDLFSIRGTLDLTFDNSIISGLHASQNGEGLNPINTLVLDRDTIAISIRNSIIWDEETTTSVYEYPTSVQGGVINFTASNSVMDSLHSVSNPALATWNVDTSLVFNVDPVLGDIEEPHFSISDDSPFKEKSSVIGIPYEGTAPDIGVNQFAYSAIGLVLSIDTLSASCDMSDGFIALNISETNKDLEFSLDGFGFQSESEFSGLAAGEYIVHIRTSDYCAHFQYEVTLGEDCGTGVSAHDIGGDKFSVHPNPFEGTLTIPESSQGLTVKVYDVNSSVVYESIIKNGILDLSYLPAGVYYAKGKSARGKALGVKRLVKI